MEKPNVQVLARIPWDLFCTFTFMRENMPEGLRRKYYFSFLRLLSGDVAVHFKRLLWMLRPENGESTGRRHYHALISGIPKHVLTKRLCLVLMSQWEHQKPLVLRKAVDGNFRMLSLLCGMARIRIYEPGMDGLDYVIPEDWEVAAVLRKDRHGANAYEANKFGGVQTVEFSESLIKYLRNQAPWWSDRRKRESGKVETRAKTIQCRQRVVSDSSPPIGADDRNSPALLLQPEMANTAVNQGSVETSSLPERGEQSQLVLTGDHKSPWQEKGDGTFELVEGTGQ